MSPRITQLAIAAAAELSAALGVTVERRYAPYFDAAELGDQGKWVLLAAAEDHSREGRAVAELELALDVALQIAVPDPATRDADYLDTAWCDAQIAKLDALKALYRPGGALREKTLAACDFAGLEHAPLYRPDLLLEHSIFAGVVRLKYSAEYADE